MRVLMLSWEYPPHLIGGLGKHVAEIAPRIAAAGVELNLVTPRLAGGAPEETAERKGAAVRVHRVDATWSEAGDFYDGVAAVNLQLSRFIEEDLLPKRGFDLVHVHDWLVSFAAIEAKRLTNTPLVATIHATEYGRNHGNIGSPLQRKIHEAEWLLSYQSWKIVCCSHFMKDEVQRAFYCPPDKVVVIPNGVDPTKFRRLRDEALAEFRAGFALPYEQLIVTVGRVVYEKGVQVLVQAMPEILAKWPNAKAVVTGAGYYLDDLKSLSDQLKLGPKMLFTGFLPEHIRDRLLAVADVVALPSLYEPFGIAALEAMAAGAPLVVSDVGGFGEIVRHLDNGITIYPNSPSSLAWGILETLAHPDEARRRAAVALAEIDTIYNWRSIARRTVGLYQEVGKAGDKVDG